MKPVSYPPFIVFFDTIAVFLFFLILNQNKQIVIEPPEKSLFTGAEIIYKQEGHYFRLTGGEYQPSPSDGDFIYFLDCKNRLFECQQAKSEHGNDVYILLPQMVYNDIAKLTVLAFGSQACTNIKYYISVEGGLDYVKIKKRNPCLNKIPGFKERVEKVKASAF